MQNNQPTEGTAPRHCLVIRYAHPTLLGHGGQRRSWQIEQRLRADGFVCEELVVPPLSRWRRLRNALASGPAAWWRLRRMGFSWRGVMDAAAQYAGFAALSAERYACVAIEATNCLAAAAWARTEGRRVLAFPHNVESLVDPLVGSPADPRRLGRRLPDEICALRLMDEVHAITPEDAWFFAQFGIAASVFPYRCAGPVAIPADGSPRHRILVAGSATNPPTAEGLRVVFREAPPIPGLIYTVIGAGTGTLCAWGERPDFEVLGPVPPARLQELLAETRFALCYQTYGTGMLTRVDDLLAAGIPVWCNRHAARGYGPRPGLHIFGEWRELAEAAALPEKCP